MHVFDPTIRLHITTPSGPAPARPLGPSLSLFAMTRDELLQLAEKACRDPRIATQNEIRVLAESVVAADREPRCDHFSVLDAILDA